MINVIITIGALENTFPSPTAETSARTPLITNGSQVARDELRTKKCQVVLVNQGQLVNTVLEGTTLEESQEPALNNGFRVE